ncbi:hypothetical protein ACW9G8_02235 [Nocardia gipuzkoensis]
MGVEVGGEHGQRSTADAVLFGHVVSKLDHVQSCPSLGCRFTGRSPITIGDRAGQLRDVFRRHAA